MKTQNKIDAVYIRKPQRSDQKEFLEKVASSQKSLVPWIIIDPSKIYYQAYLGRLKRNNVGFFICSKLSDAILGVININDIVQGGFQSGFLGYYAFKGFQGEGSMKAGLNLVLKEAFLKIKLHRLEANIQPGNKSSIFLVKSCGFQKEGLSPRYLKVNGRWRDHERWAIVKEN